ncbi:MAG: phage minor structural protein [Clostridiales bacterium]|jgi:hypothetical protein|nr:phage minor structural protein [Clostridiales bacterium]
MNKEQFIALGFTEEQAKKAAEASQEELKSYVEKQKFDTVSDENKNLKTTVKENAAQLETLKKSVDEEVKKQIADIQVENAEKLKQQQEQINNMKVENAIKLAIKGKTQDDDLVASLIDKGKVSFDDTGKPIGLDDQLKSLNESKAFLFKQEDTTKTNTDPKPGFHVGGDGKSNQQQSKPTNLFEAVASHFQNTANSQK